jgi:hypothetical protein
VVRGVRGGVNLAIRGDDGAFTFCFIITSSCVIGLSLYLFPPRIFLFLLSLRRALSPLLLLLLVNGMMGFVTFVPFSTPPYHAFSLLVYAFAVIFSFYYVMEGMVSGY